MVALCTPHHRLRLDVGLGIISRLRRRLGKDARAVRPYKGPEDVENFGGLVVI